MKKFTKTVMAIAVIAASVAPTVALAHDIWECGGRVPLRFGGLWGNSSTPHGHWKTRIHGTNQASSVWHDWTWRGKSQNIVQYCSKNSISCIFTWSGSKTVGYSNSTGTSVGFDLAYGGQDVGKRWTRDETYSKSTTQTWTAGTRFKEGYWAEPVVAVARRWKQGYFAGFFQPMQQVSWDLCNNNLAWAYNWFGEKRDGHWVKNQAEYTFKLIHITNDRNKL